MYITISTIIDDPKIALPEKSHTTYSYCALIKHNNP